SAGAGLRDRAQADVEEQFPLGPMVRVAASLGASFTYSMLLGLVFLLQALFILDGPHMTLDEIIGILLLGLVITYLGLLTFLLSYWLKQPILGGGLALILLGGDLFLTIGALINWHDAIAHGELIVTSLSLISFGLSILVLKK